MKHEHIDALTWLRGLAAFFVIVSHSFRATDVSYTGLDEAGGLAGLQFLALGSFGVGLFFVLSGCALWISAGNMRHSHQLWQFYVKRFFRIWPAFFISVLLYIVFVMFFKENYPVELQGYWIEDLANDNFGLEEVLLYLSLTFNFTGPSNLMNNAYWSLPVEFQFYLIFPLIVASLIFFRSAGPIIVAVLLYMVDIFQLINIDKYHVFSLSFTFCGGVLLGYLFTEKKIKVRLHWAFCSAICLSMFALAAVVSNGLFPQLHDIPGMGRAWHWLGPAAIITVGAILFSDIPKIENPFTQFLKNYGDVSYSTYLYHNMVLGVAVLLLLGLGINNGVVKIVFTLVFTLVVTYFIAQWSYKYVEVRGIKFGSALSKKIIPKTTAAEK